MNAYIVLVPAEAYDLASSFVVNMGRKEDSKEKTCLLRMNCRVQYMYAMIINFNSNIMIGPACTMGCKSVQSIHI